MTSALCILLGRWLTSSRFRNDFSGRKKAGRLVTCETSFSKVFFSPSSPPSSFLFSLSFFVLIFFLLLLLTRVISFYRASRGLQRLDFVSSLSLCLLCQQQCALVITLQRESVYIPGDGQVAGPSQVSLLQASGHTTLLFFFSSCFVTVFYLCVRAS